jgi:hypothetical protein
MNGRRKGLFNLIREENEIKKNNLFLEYQYGTGNKVLMMFSEVPESNLF